MDMESDNMPQTAQPPRYIVGIGASAGGLEALEQFFAGIGPNTEMSFVVVQHLSPDYKSVMAELLSRKTSMPVRVIETGMTPEPNTVNLIPPRMNLTIERRTFQLIEKPAPSQLNLPIDIFLKSLAKEYGDRCVAVILSGTGSDGTRGVRAVHEAGGVVVTQSPSSAKFDGMPRSAIASGVTDLIDDVPTITNRLNLMAESGRQALATVSTFDSVSSAQTTSRILQMMSDATGVNFSGYKQSTVGRRIARRMAINHITEIAAYGALVQASQDEKDALFRDLLIGVTRFFRDRETWSALQRLVIRPLVADIPHGGEFRAWVPGCSTGEEAYTLAMLIDEEVRAQRRLLDVKIFATDIDSRAIDTAIRGVFPESVVADIEPERLAEHFKRQGDSFEVKANIRKSVMFASHNVTRDPAFTRLDLISCRNLLIYFEQHLQELALRSFHFGLKPGGALLLGSSESLGTYSDRFTTVDSRLKIFRSGPSTKADFPNRTSPSAPVVARSDVRTASPTNDVSSVARNTLNDRYLPPAVVVDTDFRLLEVFGRTNHILTLKPGVPALRILDMVHPSISRVLASAVPSAIRAGTAMTFHPVVFEDDGPEQSLQVIPLTNQALVVFDAGRIDRHAMSTEANDTDPQPVSVAIDAQVAGQLEQLQRELQVSMADQQALVEELETSNEELQATNEELLAANEELQSSNEELQSVNEELHTVNAEYQQKFVAFEQLTTEMNQLLAATDIGILFLDGNLAIRTFTPTVTNFFPILESDIGRPLNDLALKSSGAELISEIEHVLTGGVPAERLVDTHVGPVLVRILPYESSGQRGVLVTYTDVTEVQRPYDLARRVFDVLPAQVALIDSDGTIRIVNGEWERFGSENGANPSAIGVGSNYLDACTGEDGERMRAGIESVLRGELEIFTMEYPCDTPTEARWFLSRCTTTADHDAVVVIHFDVTAQKQAERLLSVLATQDHLTGVLNRRGFDQQLNIEQSRIRRRGVPAAGVLIDCDDFKQINDQLGLAGGDTVLATVTRRIQGALRPGDTLARIGGDEFVVLIPEVRIAEAEVIAERIRLAVASQPVAVSHRDISLTVSASVVAIDEQIPTLEILLERTRLGLTAGKSNGKNRVIVSGQAPDSVAAMTTYQQEIQALLADERGLVTVGQRIVDLASGTTIGYELLTRTVTPSSMSPLMMFQVAQEMGVLGALDESCLRSALRTAQTLPRANVNLYPSTLLGMSMSNLEGLFSSNPQGSIVVELSEQQIVGDASYLLPFVQLLRSVGVGIAIDDVGFGRTALESLIILEPDVVKIDRTYIAGVWNDRVRQQWLTRLVRAAQSLGADLIAEGVERKQDAAVAAEIGIQFGQGLYFGRPELIDITLP
jgi:two-component system, chemotaxis family, CheB/CheR fusion protein